MSVARQIELGHLVCPRSRQPLVVDGARLRGKKSSEAHYALHNGAVPILVLDAQWQKVYADDSARMNEEYAQIQNNSNAPLRRLKAVLTQDYRTAASKQALRSLFTDLPYEALCLSIGGGPTRVDPLLCNVNIGLFDNVDVVADAHCLPYASNHVDAIHCEAVLEHLYDPALAVAEMYRVLKPGARAYVCTPFLQGYHGYPHHYQNYTLSGQQLLLRKAGFEVLNAGVAVGPVYTIVSLIAGFLNEYIPRPFNLPMRYLWGAAGALLRPLDKLIAVKKNAHIFASTTYVLGVKPNI
ncbi:MAG: hypothetical protein NVSMB6_11240 [Burkholderiaceae bacterium]